MLRQRDDRRGAAAAARPPRPCGPVKVGTRIACAERLRRGRRPRSTSPGRPSAPRSPPGAGAGSRGSARPRARSGPCRRPPRPGTRRCAVSPESMSAEVPSRIALATSLASARVGSAWCDHRLEHLRRRDHRLPHARARRRMIRFWSSGTSAAPISTPRSPRATITASVSREDLVERVDGLRLLDLRDHVRVRAGLARSARAGRARRRPSARTRARRSRRRARARSRGRPCPCA